MKKNIVITGASKGIGAETARLLAPGNEVFINYHTSDSDAEKVQKEVKSLGGTAHLVKADISTESGCLELVRLVQEKADRIDVLINNAGGLIERRMLHELNWQFIYKTFSLNTFPVMMLSSMFAEMMKDSDDPCIINITTIGIRRGSPTASAYSASKGAVDSFTRSIALELAPNIRVNAVSPGLIDTPFHDGISTRKQFEEWTKATPMKSAGKPVHIALAIKSILDNPFMCGETIDVNGGQFMR